MSTKYFDDFVEGEVHRTHGRTITEADLINYAGLSGNYHPVHLDAERMKDSEYGHRLVNGFLVVAMMQGLKIQTGMLDDSVIALYGVNDLQFREPVAIGDTIRNEITVKDLESKDSSSGIVRLEEKAINQDGDEPVIATTQTLVKKHRE